MSTWRLGLRGRDSCRCTDARQVTLHPPSPPVVRTRTGYFGRVCYEVREGEEVTGIFGIPLLPSRYSTHTNTGSSDKCPLDGRYSPQLFVLLLGTLVPTQSTTLSCQVPGW